MRAVLVILSLFILTGCKTVKPGTDYSKTDTTSIKYVPVDVAVKGAKVGAALNIDSLLQVAVQKRAKYLKDSIAAALAGKPLPKPPKETKVVTDPATKAQLTYWIDQYGRLQIGCESKDQTINLLVAEVTRLSKEVTKKTEIVKETPKWNGNLITVLSVLLVISVLINVLNKFR